jgi:DNA topoisomerase-1
VAKKSQNTGTALVIVESPAKAKTINRYLGSKYKVMASMGHVRDLPPNEIGIDFENSFEPVYQVLEAKRKVVRDLRKVAKDASTVYLATDLDREGEAIAWHLVHALGLEPDQARRVEFNEITKSAIQAAFAKPHDLDMDKVNAQQARRLLDRIVGYQVSPLLQAKLGKGLSAGRVQSVAVRLICERENEIRQFNPDESWKVFACFSTDIAKTPGLARSWETFLAGANDEESGRTAKERNAWLSRHACLYAELIRFDGKEFAPQSLADARRALEAVGYVIDNVDEREFTEYAEKGLKKIKLTGRTAPAADARFSVTDIKKRRTQSRPNPPFTTATIQQAASSALGFAPARTMRVAQQLYEGIDLGGDRGQVGLITYMRTDSTNLSKDSVASARDLIGVDFGANYVPEKPNAYASGKSAQEAHEAIRPTDVQLRPDDLKQSLTAEQFKLYDLIWRRFVACQMVPAQWDGTTILIATDTAHGRAEFRASGRRLAFDGHLRVTGVPKDGDVVLPDLQEGANVGLVHLDPAQMFTAPPPRYTEAALVKKLEAEGIGRPSTYAAIIQTVQDRGYVKLQERKLHPTERGEIVNAKLIEHFPQIMDVKFTSYMEEELDKIEDAHLDWLHVLGEFYEPFKKALEKAKLEMGSFRAEPSEYTCPECGRDMVYRMGKTGRFLSCSGYPECTVARNIDKDGKLIENVIADEPCERCGKSMVLKKSRLGFFLGCAGYPECTSTVPCDEHGKPLRKVDAGDLAEPCEECQSQMTVKFARGRAFLACSGYPKCKATKPLPEGVYVEKPKPEAAGARCDKCGRDMVIRKSRRGPFLSCVGFPKCRNAMPLDKLDELKAKEAAGEIPDKPTEIRGGRAVNGNGRSGKREKVDVESLGPPPPGFAWTRTGRPVVETWPTEQLSCPECGRPLSLKSGRFGPYFACNGYPKCRFAANLRGDAKKRAEVEAPTPAKPKPIPTEIPCEECDALMVIRTARSGPFLGCSRYPKCRFSKPLPDGETADTLAASKT